MEPNARRDFGPALPLSVDPPLFLTGISADNYLGIAHSFAERQGNIDAGFIVFPTWSIEAGEVGSFMRRAFLEHATDYPRHSFRFICNTQAETALLLAQGLPAEFLNKNCTVSDTIFHPVADIRVEFDAIYNARFVREKRHELAALVPHVAYLTYVERNPEREAEFKELYGRVGSLGAGHVLLNEMSNGWPVPISRTAVNRELGRASVGLVLSAEEGSSYASMEYMLAGLPVVSTQSTGGRDVYFDPDFCIVCEPTAEAVRDAVADLAARRLPPDEIRARTLARIAPARERFLTVIDELLGELGAPPRFSGHPWPFGASSGVGWSPYAAHLDQFAVSQARLAASPATERPAAGTQLQPQEIEPVVSAIRARPNCRLLVFGCGNDSPFWEATNSGGETAFIEDNPQWAEVTRGKLARSLIHLVRYDTQVSQWRELLESPVRLKLRLPPEIAGKTWDVILVDGPAGYDPSSPGRMKAIFAASRLVAQGGVVFVHDCEREAEAAYAAKYLSEQRLAVTARGRALLKGYAF